MKDFDKCDYRSRNKSVVPTEDPDLQKYVCSPSRFIEAYGKLERKKESLLRGRKMRPQPQSKHLAIASTIALLALLSLVFADRTQEPVQAQVPWPLDKLIYLPMGMQGVGVEALPTARKAPTFTPTPEATPTSAPTLTPEPTQTPTPESGFATISGRLTVDGAPAPLGLGDGFGPGLMVRDCLPAEEEGSAPDCELFARTGVATEDGSFSFNVSVPRAAGRYMEVVWLNNAPGSGTAWEGTDKWLGAYYSGPLPALEADDSHDLGRIEVADIILTAPSNGSGIGGLPMPFQWKVRKSEVGTYRWAFARAPLRLVEEREEKTFFHTQSLGTDTEWIMRTLPPGVQIGSEHRYFWYIVVDFPNGGRGESYYTRMHWFF